jgi:RNA polymerase-binding transcription factor DksA
VHSQLARLHSELELFRSSQSSEDIQDAVPTIEPVDFANALAERENTLALIANLESLVQMGELAVERLANGRYGLCERCNRPIAAARLEALPFATDCIECAAARR